MIKVKEVEIKGNGKTLRYYLTKGYNIKNNQKISIKIEDLIPTSSIVIECYCDLCHSSWTYERDLDENLTKKKYSELFGYNFLFIIDKNYRELKNILIKM